MQVRPSSLPADARPIRLRRRADLELTEVAFQAERTWVVKDPLAMKYIHLRPPEKLVFDSLDGKHSFREIERELERAFPEQGTRMPDLHQLVSSFHENGLLLSDTVGQHRELLKRRGKKIRQKAVEVLGGLLAIRFPGIDPDRLLTRALPMVRWVFHPWVVAVCVLLCFSALMLVLSNLTEFYSRLPGFYQFFSAQNLMLMGALLMLTKSLHELGHGFMCKHFGGECHEIGFMLLVLTPAMYCNTTDSWTFPDKWKRVAVGAAGMYFELVLAALCTFGWWYSHPGTFHYICLNLMFLCSFSTIVFNANPLLRYDGYYMLADWMEVPNMAQKSRAALLSKTRVTLLGMRPFPARMLPERRRGLFALFSVASFAYRWFVVIAILWMVVRIFKPWGLEAVGQTIALVSIAGMVAVPAWQAWKFFGYPGRLREVKKNRLITTVTGFLLLCGVVFFVPLPRTVPASFVVRPVGEQTVFVQSAGQLESVHVQPGSTVKAGDLIATLVNRELELDLARLEGDIESTVDKIQLYERLGADNDPLGREVAELHTELAVLRQQLREKKELASLLELRAPCDGIVYAVQANQPTSAQGDDLPPWSDEPLDSANLGAWLDQETPICRVGSPNEFEARLLVDQSTVRDVETGMSVSLLFDEYFGTRLESTVAGVSNERLTSVPPELTQSSGGSIVTSGDPANALEPMFPTYECLVELPECPQPLIPGMRGSARIRVADATVANRIYRGLAGLFQFE